jgi:uncharacterized membrane protein
VGAAQLAGTAEAALAVRAVRAVPLLAVGVVAGVIAAACSTSCAQRPAGYIEARAVVDRRCIECHSAKPTNRAFPIAPQGLMLDTALEMKRYAGRIEASVAVERTMPLANMSGMTDEERRVLGRWVKAGAKIP